MYLNENELVILVVVYPTKTLMQYLRHKAHLAEATAGEVVAYLEGKKGKMQKYQHSIKLNKVRAYVEDLESILQPLSAHVREQLELNPLKETIGF